MCAKLIRKPDAAIAIKNLNEFRKQKNGEVSYHTYNEASWRSVLFSTLKIDKSIHPQTARSLVRQSIFTPTQNGRMTVDSVIKEINSLEKNFRRRKFKKYVLKGCVSVIGEMPFRWNLIDGCRISIGKWPGKFEQPDDAFKPIHNISWKPKNEWAEFLVGVNGRDQTEAGYRALDAIDELRGYWNLFLNYRLDWRTTFGAAQPINKIRRGKIETLHDRNGIIVDGPNKWVDTTYVADGPLHKLDRQQAEYLRENTQIFRNKIEISPLKSEIKESLRKYSTALDKWDMQVSFLELWALLEYLTDTANRSYDALVRRAAVFRNPYQDGLTIMQHLRSRRNTVVHVSEYQYDSEALTFQLKWFVERLLLFYMDNPRLFKNRVEVGLYLDHLINIPNSRRKLELIQAAITASKK